LKYHSTNPVYNYLVNNFNMGIVNYLDQINSEINSIIEVGVGEGQILELAISRFGSQSYTAVDIAEGILKVAKDNLKQFSNQIEFDLGDIKDLQYDDSKFDLAICCEVLEHVPNAEIGVKELSRILKPEGYAIISVPNEPIWRILNMVRGYYWKDLGNTPGHVNNWSSSGIRKIIEQEGFTVLNVSKPLPWSMFLCQKR